MTNELTTSEFQFTKEELEATPKAILKILFKCLEKEINSNHREVLFLETTLTRTRDKLLPEMQETLETMIDNKKPQTQIKKQRKLINKSIDDYNQTIDEYNKSREYLNSLKGNASMIAGILDLS